MKKGLSVLFFVLVAASVLVSNVLAAPVQSNQSVALASTSYQRGGIVLLFHTSGLSKSDLKNISFVAHSNLYKLDCKFANGTTNVRCVMTQSLSMFAGESFHGALAGFYYEGVLPSARTFSNPSTLSTPLTNSSFGGNSPSFCPEGQILWYTFEYYAHSYHAEVWSDTPIARETFHSIYGVYPEYTNTQTDVYTVNGVEYLKISYIYGYTTTTSGHGTTPADNWNPLVAAYVSDGYSIQKTGESCN